MLRVDFYKDLVSHLVIMWQSYKKYLKLARKNENILRGMAKKKAFLLKNHFLNICFQHIPYYIIELPHVRKFWKVRGEVIAAITSVSYFCSCMVRYYAFFSFRRSRISMRSFSSLLGSGALGVSAGFSSSFFAVTLLTTLMSMKIQKATMRKSKVVCRKLP